MLFISCALLSLITGGQYDQWGNLTNMGLVQWPWPTTPACPPFIFRPLCLHFSRFRASWAFRPFPRGVCVHRRSDAGESWSTDASRAPPNPPIIYCHFSVYWGNDTDWRSDLCWKFSMRPNFWHSSNLRFSKRPTVSDSNWKFEESFHFTFIRSYLLQSKPKP